MRQVRRILVVAFFGIAVVFACGVQAGINGTDWTSIGPLNGRGEVLSVAPHPTVGGTVYIGAAGGGVWKRTADNVIWTPLTESIGNLSTGAVAVAPSSPNSIYLGTGEGLTRGAFRFAAGIGLLYSSDGGTNWTNPSSVIATQFYDIAIHPTSAQELIVGTNAGALRSTGGQNGPWTTVINSASAGATVGYGDVTRIVRDSSNPLILYATTFDRGKWCAKNGCSDPVNFASPTVLRSTDGGQTWTPRNTNLPVSTTTQQVNRMAIAIAPSSPLTLYLATSVYDLASDTHASYVYKTTDGGASWAALNVQANYLADIAAYFNAIAVSPTDANTVVVAGHIGRRTVNGGTSWSFVSTTPPVHDLRFDAAGTLYAATERGVWSSSDSAATFTDISGWLVIARFYSVLNDPTHRQKAIGGLHSDGTSYRLVNSPQNWSALHTSSLKDGFQAAQLPHAPSVYFCTETGGRVRRYMNSPSAIDLDNVTPAYKNEATPFYTILVHDPNSPATLYTATHRVWKSVRGGDAWIPLPTTTPDNSWTTSFMVRSLAIARSDSQILMAAKGSKIFRTTNGGTSWASASSGLPSRTINWVDIDPNDPNRAYVALSGTSSTLYYTINGGTSWTVRSTGLPAFAALVVRVDPTDSNTIYCGTEAGIYRSVDGGANWSRFGTGMPAAAVFDVHALSDGSALRAATHGRGAWELNVTGITNTLPTASINTPNATQTVTKGTSVDFSGTFSDIDSGDTVSGRWTFPDDWSQIAATSGGTVSHVFHRPGTFPVTLSATDSHGVGGAASVIVDVTPPGDDCSSPVVIPGSGPFPYTFTTNLTTSTLQASDPSDVGSCYSAPQRSVWLSFTPTVTGTYVFSACGSKAFAVVAGYTGSACGPYAATAVCLFAANPEHDCFAEEKQSVELTAGTTLRLLVTGDDRGQVSLTIARTTALTPVAVWVTPATGVSAGNTPVIVTGSGFDSTFGVGVKFGGVSATNVSVLSANLLTANTPAHAPGDVDVEVTNLGSGSKATAGLGFTYIPPDLAAPTNLVASATSTSAVAVSWDAVSGAASYLLDRTEAGMATVTISVGGTAHNDSGRTADRSYLYRVRSVGAFGEISPSSSPDVATTTLYTDDPLATGVTTVKAAHISQLRTAVDAMRTLAGVALTPFTDGSLAGGIVKALHVTELRSALDAARAQLGIPPLSYMNVVNAGSIIRAEDLTELRDGTK